MAIDPASLKYVNVQMLLGKMSVDHKRRQASLPRSNPSISCWDITLDKAEQILCIFTEPVTFLRSHCSDQLGHAECKQE